MKFFSGIALGLASIASAVSAEKVTAWSFQDASLTVQAKGTGVGGGVKEQLMPGWTGLAYPIEVSSGDSLKISLTTTNDEKAKRAHQTFLTVKDEDSGLAESFAFTTKENGKAKVDIPFKDIPAQFLSVKGPLHANIVIASFGTSAPYNNYAFEIQLKDDSPSPAAEGPERYAAKPEIHHIFKEEAQSPPKIISIVFTFAILATVPALLGGWLMLGGNITHASKAFGTSPLAHSLFFGSIVAMEAVFFMYYMSWNLFQTLPAAGVVAVVAFVSGSRALTEVQDRRLAGER